MRPLTGFVALLPLLQLAGAIRMFESSSLSSCMANSAFIATYFHVVFTPNNQSIAWSMEGESLINEHVILDFKVIGYGATVYHGRTNPCETELKGLCPLNEAHFPNQPMNLQLANDVVDRIPNPIYNIPDLDARVQLWINSTSGAPLACLETELSNGQTAQQRGVSWSMALITALCLLASAVASCLGNPNTSAHIAAITLALFGYFQSQATAGMMAVSMPPIVRAWTQNFQWSMGIVRIGFVQSFAIWYLRATGGRPATLLSSLSTTSIQLQKRTNGQNMITETIKAKTLRGIERVSFLAKIEITNLFLTSYSVFIILMMVVVLAVALFKVICEAMVRSGIMRSISLREFRESWKTVLRGILLRMLGLSFPAMIVMCLWEFTRRDSPAEVTLSAFTVLPVTGLLAWATFRIYRIARRSTTIHKNPAYELYSNSTILNKWGFLFVHFKAHRCYWLFPGLLYLFLKSSFIAFAQASGIVQAIAMVVLDTGFLIAMSIIKPYMDKKTNAFNISIAAINFINSLLLLLFSGIFGVPALGIAITGVLFFLINAVFTLVILLMTIWISIRAMVSRNPETRFETMQDDRGSFAKSTTNLDLAELQALGAVARGDFNSHHTLPTREYNSVEDIYGKRHW